MWTARREDNAAVVGGVSNGKEECVERVLLAAEREVDAAAWCRGGGGGAFVAKTMENKVLKKDAKKKGIRKRGVKKKYLKKRY